SLRIAPGGVLGVLGRTGSGKTTLARLLLRFYDPTAGAVRLGGVDARDARLAEVRARATLVSQDVQLFHASVRDNLTLFDHSISDERIRDVLERIGLGPWLRSLPDDCGLDTELRSGALSAGEAQLVAFARVFLRDPGLVVLDEASSRLDPATERHIENAIDELLDRRTAIVIAHRLATVERCDEIAILENGRVVEHGPRHALAVDPSSRFHELLRIGLEEVLAWARPSGPTTVLARRGSSGTRSGSARGGTPPTTSSGSASTARGCCPASRRSSASTRCSAATPTSRPCSGSPRSSSAPARSSCSFRSSGWSSTSASASAYPAGSSGTCWPRSCGVPARARSTARRARPRASSATTSSTPRTARTGPST